MNDSFPGPAEIARRVQHLRRARPTLQTEYVPALGDVERNIAAVWEEVLKLAPIGRLDNFFDLGGDSLRLVQIANRVAELENLELEYVDLFDYPTISAFAKRIAELREDQEDHPRSDR